MEGKKSLTALIHPVATMIISNHFTRMALLNDNKFIPVVGALLGKQSSRTIEVQNCFEVETKFDNNKWQLNTQHFENREKLYQETFPDQNFLGFYVVGNHQHVDDFDNHLYQLAASTSDMTVVLLKMSPLIDPLSDKIPINVFESIFDVQSGHHNLSPVNVEIISNNAEQISTDHAVKFTYGTDKGDTTAAKKLNEQAGALKMLWKGLSVSVDYLKVVSEGGFPPDEEVLRELNKLAIKLDYLQKHQIKPKSSSCTINDNLIVLLTMNNKIAGSVFSIVGKLNTIISEHNNPGPSQQTPMKRKENF